MEAPESLLLSSVPSSNAAANEAHSFLDQTSNPPFAIYQVQTMHFMCSTLFANAMDITTGRRVWMWR
jgi:hypothetical protein